MERPGRTDGGRVGFRDLKEGCRGQAHGVGVVWASEAPSKAGRVNAGPLHSDPPSGAPTQ